MYFRGTILYSCVFLREINMETTSHMSESATDESILFSTPFDYMIPTAAHREECLLPRSSKTVEGLIKLGETMALPVPDPADFPTVSSIPSFFTYFGQFIDHDMTVRTDRDTTVSIIKDADRIEPIEPDHVKAQLINGRRPFLDLDSLYGDGPALAGRSADAPTGTILSGTGSDKFYADNLRFNQNGNTPLSRDIPRNPNNSALVADERNSENTNIAQVHAIFLSLHNKIAGQLSLADDVETFIRARQLTRWTYQYIVLNQYLMTVCDRGVALDTLVNGPRFLGSGAGRPALFMPLEFSVAGFRIGHSMIRPQYNLGPNGQSLTDIQDILFPAQNPSNFTGNHLNPELTVNWNLFVKGGQTDHPLFNFAQKLDPFLAKGLFNLPENERLMSPVLRHLAISNLLRGYSLSIPTGQALCAAFEISPLSSSQMLKAAQQFPSEEPNPESHCCKEPVTMANTLRDYGFLKRTPLWFYLLMEAHLQTGGESLGELGSRIMCETIIALIKEDPNSVLNNCCDEALRPDGPNPPGFPTIGIGGVKLPGPDAHLTLVGTIEGVLEYLGWKFEDEKAQTASKKGKKKE